MHIWFKEFLGLMTVFLVCLIPNHNFVMNQDEKYVACFDFRRTQDADRY